MIEGLVKSGRCCFVCASKPYPKLKPLIWVSAQDGVDVDGVWCEFASLSSGARGSFHAVLHSLLPATISRTKLGVATILRKKLSGKKPPSRGTKATISRTKSLE